MINQFFKNITLEDYIIVTMLIGGIIISIIIFLKLVGITMRWTMEKVNYTFRTKDQRSYFTVKEDYSDIGEARAYNYAKVEIDRIGEDIRGLTLYSIK